MPGRPAPRPTRLTRKPRPTGAKPKPAPRPLPPLIIDVSRRMGRKRLADLQAAMATVELDG